MNEQASLVFYLRWGRGRHRKPWGRRRAREEERMSDKEEGEGGWESSHGIWTDIHRLLISSFTCEAVAIICLCVYLCSHMRLLYLRSVCMVQPCVIHWKIHVHILCRCLAQTLPPSVTLACFTETMKEGRLKKMNTVGCHTVCFESENISDN